MQSSEVQGLGQLLSETRERKGATIADAQQATKIRQSFLQALENENYGVLPPPFYIRGFIKTYALFLGLDPRETVQIFDQMLENESLSRLNAFQPSADSGGRGPTYPMQGLSQGEARMIEANGERLNLTALPAPTLPGQLSRPVGTGSADSSGESRAIVPSSQRNLNGLHNSQKYVLKPVMLPTARGAFYMPNFVPAVLVAIIVAAACLLVYRGISAGSKDATSAASATQTAGVSNSSAPGGGIFGLGIGGRLTPTVSASSYTGMTPPPFYTPDSAIEALAKPDQTRAAGTSTQLAPAPLITQGGILQPDSTPTPAPTATPAPPTATPIPPSPTPIPPPITVEVTVGSSFSNGSWLTITVDDKQEIAKIVPPGQVLTFTGRKIGVRAGNPGAITVTVNGEPREYTKPQSGVITHYWYADGRDIIEN